MTVIAWDGKTLAADKMASSGGHKFAVTKIHAIGECLVGFCGSAPRSREVLAWIENGRNVAEWSKPNADEWSSVIVIWPDGKIEVYESSPHPYVVENKTHAIGAGRDYAAATMLLGFDATKAVEVAIALSDSCGLGIDTLVFP